MAVLGYAAVVLVGVIVVAVFWDAFLRGRRGLALVFGALALTTAMASGWLRAEDEEPWSWILLLASIALTGIGAAFERSASPHD